MDLSPSPRAGACAGRKRHHDEVEVDGHARDRRCSLHALEAVHSSMGLPDLLDGPRRGDDENALHGAHRREEIAVMNKVKSRRRVDPGGPGHVDAGRERQREVLASNLAMPTAKAATMLSEPIENLVLSQRQLPSQAVGAQMGLAAKSAAAASRRKLVTGATLEGFRLDSTHSSRVEQKESKPRGTKSRVTKPVPKRRAIHGITMSTPKIQPVPSALTNMQAQSKMPNCLNHAQEFRVPSDVVQTVAFSTDASTWGAHVDVKKCGKRSAPGTTAGQPVVDDSVLLETMDTAFDEEFEDCSSDEELCMENDLSLSQNKLGNLSMCDDSASDDDDEDGDTNTDPNLMLTLSAPFLAALSEQEQEQLKDIGVHTIPLKVQRNPVVMGRDHFFTVFGSKILGYETFHISRRHCLFHVARALSDDISAPVKVTVENTSTNGLDINGHAMGHRECRDLKIGDKVTLLKIRYNGDDVSLAYVVSQVDTPRLDADLQHAAPAETKVDVKLEAVCSEVSNISPKPHTEISLSSDSEPCSSKFRPFPQICLDVLIAEPCMPSSTAFSSPVSGYRDELTTAFANFSSVDRLKIEYDCATKMSIIESLCQPYNILIYAGENKDSCIVTEDQNGMPSFVPHMELTIPAATENSKNKLVVVFAKNIRTAELFVDAGCPHVIFIEASSHCRSKSLCYLRALIACMLKGMPIHRCHTIAERTSLGPSSRIDSMYELPWRILPDDNNHEILVGEVRDNHGEDLVDPYLACLNASLIPTLTSNFMAREEPITKVIGSLRKNRAQVCTLNGEDGVGKSSIAVYVAKYATDRHWYKHGVQYIDVAAEFDEINAKGNQLNTNEDIDAGNSKVMETSQRLWSDVHGILEQIRFCEAESAMLLILDGCDNVDGKQLGDFLRSTIQRNPGVQILVTRRCDRPLLVGSNEVEERVVSVSGLNNTDTAALFFASAKSHLDPSAFSVAMKNQSAGTLAIHPTLNTARGIPRLIIALARQLTRTPLADL